MRVTDSLHPASIAIDAVGWDQLPPSLLAAARDLAGKTGRTVEDASSAIWAGTLHAAPPSVVAPVRFAEFHLSCGAESVARFIDLDAYERECLDVGALLAVIHEGQPCTVEPFWMN